MREIGPRQLVEITTVDQIGRRVETKLKDGGMVSVPIMNIPTLFRWPKVGEYWIIRRDGGQWSFVESVDPSLQMRDPDDPDEKAILVENMREGEVRVIATPNEEGSGLWINRHQAIRKANYTLGEAKKFTLDHKFGTKHVSVSLFRDEEQPISYPVVTIPDENTVTLEFSEIIPKDSVLVIIAG